MQCSFNFAKVAVFSLLKAPLVITLKIEAPGASNRENTVIDGNKDVEGSIKKRTYLVK